MTPHAQEHLTQTLHDQLKEKEDELRRVLALFPGYLWSVELDSQGGVTHVFEIVEENGEEEAEGDG